MKVNKTQFAQTSTFDQDGPTKGLGKTDSISLDNIAIGTSESSEVPASDPEIRRSAQALFPKNALLGAKGRNLLELKTNNLPVPEFFVVTPDAFYESLPDETRGRWSDMSSQERLLAVTDLSVKATIVDSINDRLGRSGCSSVAVAVRSSSPEEDGDSLSYAGQFLSILNVEKHDIPAAVAKVWRSAFTTQVLEYRRLSGIDSPLKPPAVIIQRMVNAKTAGVAFGADPVSGNTDVVTIAAVNGFGDKLVSGETDSATYQIRKTKIVMRNNEHLGPMSDDQLLAVCRLTEQAGSIFGAPQDIEWAIDQEGTLNILQARPITTFIDNSADSIELTSQDENQIINIFDNSNIAESYPGITTPLTFSFARKAYQHVYEEFCRLMGVSEKAIEKHAYIFPQMLGFIRGRIYYNLLNWYVLLSLFPGFKTNRTFMEQMMGVKAGLPQEVTSAFDKPTTIKEQVFDTLNVILLLPKLLNKWRRLPADINKFNSRVDCSLQKAPMRLNTLGVGGLAKLYRSLEQDLLLHWDAPIVNDFFAMISFGVLRAACDKWLTENDGIHNQLLCGETGIISTEPVRRMNELARLAANDSSLLDVLKSEHAAGILEKIYSYPEFEALFVDYMSKFGDRCTGELKLESPTVTDNPMGLLRAISKLTSDTTRLSNTNSKDFARSNRDEAERIAYAALGKNPLKALVFKLVLNETRTRIRERENLRFMRTRVFGVVRKIFVAIGKELANKGKLQRWEDIFYLETEEVLRYIEGTSTTSNLKALAEARRQEQAMYENMATPKDRLIIRGGLHTNGLQADDDVCGSTQSSSTAPVKELKGLGCCPGILSGKVRIIDDPNNQHLEQGEILVAKRTDPGWITVIAQAKGIVVEYGSLLSHTAIVARELGIPTIVSVSGVTSLLNNGDQIEMNGATGLIKVIEVPLRATPCVASTNHGCREMVQQERCQSVTDSDIVAPALCTIIKSEIEHKAGFDFVRYAQCWEDADVLVEAMSILPADTCLSIASAGDNTLALLASSPARVVALDLNPAQLYLFELKVTAFKHLGYDDMLVLLGYRAGDSIRIYNKIRSTLSAPARSFWDNHLEDIESGVSAAGKFENYFRLFRNYVLPLVHTRSTIDELLKPKTREQREAFYTKRWNTWKWNRLFKIFFSERVMGLLGRDPSFFAYADGGLAATLLKWVKKALVDQDPTKNPYLHWILKGRFGAALPYFLRAENFEAIKRNIDKVEWHQMSVEEYLSKNPSVRFNSFNLSDVFEYMSLDSYATLMKLIAAASHPGARLVYWNMMAPRSGGNLNMNNLISHTDLSIRLFSLNQTFFYSRFVVEEIAAGNGSRTLNDCDIDGRNSDDYHEGLELDIVPPPRLPERAA